MKFLKSKLGILFFLSLFVVLTSFNMSVQLEPCYYGTMYFRDSFAYPAWPYYMVEWICSGELEKVCTLYWNTSEQRFDPCLYGQAISYVF